MNNEILRILMQGYNDLHKKNENITTSDLEAEIINIASYIYLKDSEEIDFQLDYLDDESLKSLNSYDLDLIDELFDSATMIFPEYYTMSNALHGKQAVRVNIQQAKDYGSFLKSYFLSKHQILYTDFEIFISSNNSRWIDGVKQANYGLSQRIINYKFDFENEVFEIMIYPFNPIVKGKIQAKNNEKVKCVSFDKQREFEFIFKEGQIFEVAMQRLDRGDTVIYHK
jgi:hypothetical protein